MKKLTLALILVADIAIISCGFSVHYYDLWLREYKPIKVEYYVLGYRPTYYIEDPANRGTWITLRGSWTLDFLQVSILVATLASLVLWFAKPKEIDNIARSSK